MTNYVNSGISRRYTFFSKTRKRQNIVVVVVVFVFVFVFKRTIICFHKTCFWKNCILLSFLLIKKKHVFFVTTAIQYITLICLRKLTLLVKSLIFS